MGGNLKTISVLALSLAATLSFTNGACAAWQDHASRGDLERLGQLPQIRAAALGEARGRGHGDTGVIAGVMNAQGRGVSAGALTGAWRCRQLKLGGMESYMVYSAWFTCRIHARNGGLMLQKLNGTQRFQGALYPENGAWVYLGASSARGEGWHTYSGNSASLGAAVTPDDQIGVLTSIGNNHLRLEIPAVQESLLDVVEFRR